MHEQAQEARLGNYFRHPSVAAGSFFAREIVTNGAQRPHFTLGSAGHARRVDPRAFIIILLRRQN